MKVLVTGADGFVGQWLVEHLEASGDEVWKATGSRSGEAVRRRPMDLLDPSSVLATVAWARPDAIYHLGAVAFAPDAAADLAQAIDVNVRGTGFLLEAAAEMRPSPIVFIPSSSDVYGPVDSTELDERPEPAPVTLYGATKLAQESLALTFHRAGKLRVVVARAFNHIGPGQRESFVVPAFAAQLAEIAGGLVEPVIRVGNLEAIRDFTDVRDVVRAYRMLTEGLHAGEPINVASGRPIAIRSLLEMLVAVSGLDVSVKVDPTRLRHRETRVVVGNSARLRELTGWSPHITLDQTVRDVWREMLDRHQ